MDPEFKAVHPLTLISHAVVHTGGLIRWRIAWLLQALNGSKPEAAHPSNSQGANQVSLCFGAAGSQLNEVFCEHLDKKNNKKTAPIYVNY